jgi:steroid delta-isomerase-like uncharacterized protein
MNSDNVAVARRWFEEVWNQRRAEVIHELVTPQSVCHSDSGELLGPETFRERVYQPFVAALPDLRVNVEATVAEGDHVVVRWTATGTHTGHGFGFPASGRPISIRGITWIRFAGGKMMEGWDCWNLREMIESLK